MIQFKKSSDGIYWIDGTGRLKIGTAGKSANTTSYGRDSISIRSEEKDFLEEVTGISKKNIVMLSQVHGDEIVLIDKVPEKDMPFCAEADGMITPLPGICLVIRTADCVPVAAYDRKQKVLGAVHSGWRGCRLSISRKLIADMKRLFATDPRDVDVFLLPSIGPESYTVNEDVAAHFREHVERRNPSIFLNLWSSIERSLFEEGVPRENIFNSGLCTMKNGPEFFSHRNRDEGRNLNFCYFLGQE